MQRPSTRRYRTLGERRRQKPELAARQWGELPKAEVLYYRFKPRSLAPADEGHLGGHNGEKLDVGVEW